MKKIIFTLLFLISVSGFCQVEFGEIGAKYTYHTFYPETGTSNLANQYTIEKDTLIEDKVFKKITKSDGKFEFITEEEGKIKIYYDGQIRTVFDATAQVGDTIIVFENSFNGFFERNEGEFIGNKSLGYKIAKIDSVKWNGQTFLRQDVELIGDFNGLVFREWEFGEIVFPFGSILKSNTLDYAGEIILDGSMFGGLPAIVIYTSLTDYIKCYEGIEETIVFEENDYDCEGKFTSIDQIQIPNINIYPNPMADFLFIEDINNSIASVKIFNSKMQEIKEESVNLNIKINTKSLTIGIYYLQIKLSNDNILLRKLLKI